MNTIVFNEDELFEAINNLTEAYNVYAPASDGDYYNFKPLDTRKKNNFNFQNTRMSAKSILYPQSEGMFECSSDPAQENAGVLREVEKEYAPLAVIGIRPCDAHAFKIVKRNFDNPEHKDPWWNRRYESALLVGLGCNNPCATCFCDSAGGGPFDEKMLDVMLYDLGDKYLAKGITEKGDDFLKNIKTGNPADEDTLKQANELAESVTKKMDSNVKTDGLAEKNINDLFNASFWEEVAFACINCGTCTFLCPTCWCFDIQDETSGKEVLRLRNWDTCMSPLFTLEGSGHNPRTEKVQRVRQRFMHKLKYYVDKYENGIQCSGCGRCVRYCPVNIDIRQVAELMNNHSKQ